tara:strand:- start:1277 stop:2380 length:1104 start_codon:yes stop_codon:yes gene_type:complete
MRNFKKKILIISPQSWTNFFNSKHHYSIELNKKGYEIYFLNPFQYLNNEQLLPYKIEKNKLNINIIKLKFFLPSYFEQINNFFLKFCIIKMSKILSYKFDIVWCFDEKNFNLASFFKSKKKILQVMDPIEKSLNKNDKLDFDYIVTLSKKLILKKIKKKIIITNHGLSQYFLSYKHKKRKQKKFDKIIGLYGNFLSGRFNLKLINKLIKKNPNYKFFFFGITNANHPYMNLLQKTEVLSDLKKLRLNSNVKFFENLSQNVLAKKLDICDIFMYPSKLKKNIDAHKLIELIYLGKPIVTSKFFNYSKTTGLLYFPKKNDFESFDSKLKQIVINYKFYSNVNLYKKRKNFASSRSYSRLIKKILKKINE